MALRAHRNGFRGFRRGNCFSRDAVVPTHATVRLASRRFPYGTDFGGTSFSWRHAPKVFDCAGLATACFQNRNLPGNELCAFVDDVAFEFRHSGLADTVYNVLVVGGINDDIPDTHEMRIAPRAICALLLLRYWPPREMACAESIVPV